MKKHYKIVGICQVYNELERENIVRFFEYNKKYAEEWVIYDDCSTDGTFEYCQSMTSHVIRGTKNDFSGEMSHKQILLNEALKLGADFILWLDADEVLSETSNEKLQEVCEYCEKNEIDGLKLKKINLWRSATWERTDSLYDEGWFVQLWRITPGIGYENVTAGLHKLPYPSTMKKLEKTEEFAVLHYGFANELNLAFKYLTYKSHGQNGYVMLDRIVNEDLRVLSKVQKEKFPEGLWIENEEEPKKLDKYEIGKYLEKYKPLVRRPKYSICCLIYKSVGWLEFVYESVLKHTDMSDKEFYFIANDATQEVLDYLRTRHIPHYVWENTEEQKKEWHINNVYRAYNYGVEVAKGDFVCMINSDMVFSPNWFEELIKSYDGKNCIASRLVESGKLKSGTYGIEMDFGYSYGEYREDDFLNYVDSIKTSETKDGGLFMPLYVSKKHFQAVGGYPEGNITASSDIFNPVIAKKGEELISGDNVFMMKMKSLGIRHQTSFGSVVYHFQSGELDETESVESHSRIPEIAVCNDLTTGINGEKVLWDYLIEGIPGAYSLDKRTVGKFGDFEYKAREYVASNHPDTEIIIQNASFIGTIDKDAYTIVFLQDDLRSMGMSSIQQEENLRDADLVVTNSIQTALSYPEFDHEIISVGLNTELFRPGNKAELRKKHGFDPKKKIGIFVGSFSEVKGWSKVVDCMASNPDMDWIAVTKYDENFEADNVRVFKQISQEVLAELHGCADFFIIGSPVETQCLAAIEAGLCGLPVVMPLTGLFKDFSEEERSELGVFASDLKQGVRDLQKKEFAKTRELLIGMGLDVATSVKRWNQLIERVFEQKRALEIQGKRLKEMRQSSRLSKLGFYCRKYVLRYLGLEYFDFKKLTSVKGIKWIVFELLVKTNTLNFVKKALGPKLRKKVGFVD